MAPTINMSTVHYRNKYFTFFRWLSLSTVLFRIHRIFLCRFSFLFFPISSDVITWNWLESKETSFWGLHYIYLRCERERYVLCSRAPAFAMPFCVISIFLAILCARLRLFGNYCITWWVTMLRRLLIYLLFYFILLQMYQVKEGNWIFMGEF